MMPLALTFGVFRLQRTGMEIAGTLGSRPLVDVLVSAVWNWVSCGPSRDGRAAA